MIFTPRFWKQWLVVVIVLAAIAIIVVLGFPQIYDAYMVEVCSPRLQKQLGFRTVIGRHKGTGSDAVFYISAIDKGGVFDRAGVKPGFIPFGYMHGSEDGFYGQLEGSRGEKTTLRFIEASPNRNDIIHTIEIEVPIN